MSSNTESAEPPCDHMEFIEGALKDMTDLVHVANTLPIGTARDLFCTYSAFHEITDLLSENVIDLSNNVLHMQGIKNKFKKQTCLEFKDSNTLVDCNDQVLDQMETLMDTMEGIRKMTAPTDTPAQVSSWNKTPVIHKKMAPAPEVSAPIVKPQTHFKDTVDNSYEIWKPRIMEKPNAMVPLDITEEFNQKGEHQGYAHPYVAELQQYEPLNKFMTVSSPITLPPEDTQFTFIDTLAKLEELVEHLKTVDAIAVDTEHNSQRTFQGITCLIQITTEDCGDFIIDALALRENIHLLNVAFTDPTILKVFHGAFNDILWLQRDFGVYVVGLFDTFIAAQRLGLPVKSLQALVKSYCNIQIDKTYQMADWRARPLSEAMLNYARGDTHYLLYIWRRMTKDLAAKVGSQANVISVHEQSRILCMSKYNKPEPIDENSHLQLVSRYHFNPKQMIAAKWLYKWRDDLARKEDESCQYVMPDHMLVRLAELQPRDVQGVVGICSPLPPLLRQHVGQVHTIILASREYSALNPMPLSATTDALPAEVMLTFTPHDTLGWAENGEELDAATTMEEPSAGTPHGNISEVDSIIADLATDFSAIAHKFKIIRTSMKRAVFLPPYDRYRKYRSITEDEETKKLRRTEAKIFAINKNSSVTNIIERDLVLKHDETELDLDNAI